MHARALWITEDQRAEIREEALATPEDGELLVRTLYSGVSRGTERLVFNGQVPESEHQRMRAPYQCGDFPWPVKYGYINVGRVEQGPGNWPGRTVFCLYPHQDLYVVPVDAVTPLPDSVPAERAVLCANMETAINALWDARPAIGDRITVVGAGVVGCLVAWLAAALPGCEVELVDIDSDRATLAHRLGADFCAPQVAQADRDVVVHASASEAGLQTCLSVAGQEALLIELSWYGKRSINVPLGESFHARRLQLKSSQVGSIAPDQQPRWTYRRRLELALSLLQDPVLDTLISGESDFDELPDTLAHILGDAGGTLCHRIRYSDN